MVTPPGHIYVRYGDDKKQNKIRAVLADYPEFRGGWFHLAITWLQLGRDREAHETLLQYHALDPEDPVVAYYLAATAQERRALTQLRRSLRLQTPE